MTANKIEKQAVAPKSADEQARERLAQTTKDILALRGDGAQKEIAIGRKLLDVKNAGYYAPDYPNFTSYVKAAFARFDTAKMMRLAQIAGHPLLDQYYADLGYSKAYMLKSQKQHAITESLIQQVCSLGNEQARAMLAKPPDTSIAGLEKQRDSLVKQVKTIQVKIADLDVKITAMRAPKPK